MSYDSYEIPDGITPFIGYRGWVVRDDALVSCYREVEWPVAGPLNSECIRPTYREGNGVLPAAPKHYWAPHMGCTCGIYALHEYPKVWDFNNEGGKRKTSKPWPSDAVTGLIQGWGHIIVGDKGFRAQYARPIALISRPRSQKLTRTIDRLADRYGIEIVDVNDLRRYQ